MTDKASCSISKTILERRMCSRRLCCRRYMSNWWVFSDTTMYNFGFLTNIPWQTSEDLQRHITCLKTLAQIAILYIASRVFPAHRFPICLRSLSDNTGAESGSNKLWSMSYPLFVFLEKLCVLSATTGMEIDVSHIPGAQNIIADDLSRWDQKDQIPHGFSAHESFVIDLHSLWNIRQTPSLAPSHADIPWTLPS